MKTKLSIIFKHGNRKTGKYYIRIREGKKEKLLPVGRSLPDAERQLRAAVRVQEEIADLEAEGKPVPDELRRKLITMDTPLRRSEGMTTPVGEPGSCTEKWERQMRLENMRSTTIANYQRAFRVLLKGKEVDSLSPSDVKTLMLGLKVKPNSIRFYKNALKSLFSWAGRHDLVEALPKVKYEQKDRPFWNDEQLDDIIQHVRSDSAARTIEYKDYFRVMATIGSRQGETYMLRWKDLHDGCLTFVAEHTKSRKERTVPIPYDLWSSLEVRRGNPEDRMFPLVSPSQSRRYRVLRRALDELGLDGGLHTFRHSVSMLLYKKCGDLKAVSQLLGHSPQVALQYYQNARSVDDLRGLLFDE